MVQQNKNMVILVGNIGSGKSTYAKDLANDGYLIYNDDGVINLLHANCYNLYDEDLRPIYKSIENSIISSILQSGINIVIDRPNMCRSTRNRYISIAQVFGYTVDCVLFNKNIHECVQDRMQQDSRGLSKSAWTEAAVKQHSEFDMPYKNEGFNSIIEI